MKTLKKVCTHIFIDGLGGMTHGLFATLIIGTILQQIGVAVKYRESSLVTVSAAIAGVIGGYASQLLAGTFFVDGNVIFSGPGEPLGAFVAAFVGITFGHLISGKTLHNRQ